MKKIEISDNQSIDKITERLKSICPDYKIKTFGKKNIIIKNKPVMLVISKNKNELKVRSDINYKYNKILIAIIFGVLLGIIGVFFIIIALYIIYNKKRKNFHREIFSKLCADYKI